MKRSLNLSMLLLAISVIAQPIFAKSDVNLSTKSDGFYCKERCKSFINITAEDINDASHKSRKGLVLDRPGNYKLCENVNWKARKSNSYAITIKSDNVTLDLDGHFIKQLDTKLNTNFGVNVAQNVESITIKNGLFDQLSGGAITVQEGVHCIKIDGITLQASCYNSTLDFPVSGIFGTAGWGIFLNGLENNQIQDVIISNCTFCNIGKLGTVFKPLGAAASIFTNFASMVTLENITIQDVFGNVLGAGILTGLSSAITISNVNISGITGNSLLLAIAFGVVNNLLVEDVSINDVTLTLQNPGVNAVRGAEGVKITSVNDFVLRRVSVTSLTVQTEIPTPQIGPDAPLAAVGFDLDSYLQFGFGPNINGLVEDCSAVGMHSDGGLLAGNNSRSAGFNWEGTTNTHFVNCVAADAVAPIGWAFGFGAKVDPRLSQGPNAGNTLTNCSVYSMSAFDDGIFAAGYILNGAHEIISQCTAHDITGNAGYGIVLASLSTGNANNCCLLNNELTTCSTAGIWDNTVAKNSVITGNYAALNGPGGAGPNYLNVNGFVPLALWKPYLASPAPATPSNLVNFDIQN